MYVLHMCTHFRIVDIIYIPTLTHSAIYNSELAECDAKKNMEV